MTVETEFVDGQDWISDESSFYGDDELKSALERKSKRKLKMAHDPFAEVVTKSIKLNPKSNARKDESVFGFLKSRPQIAALEKDATANRGMAGLRTGRTLKDVEAADLLRDDRFKGNPAAWQRNETIDDFLRRVPVADPATASVGPWLWVKSAKTNSMYEKHAAKEDIDAFIEAGDKLLGDFLKQRSEVEAENTGKAAATVTRYMNPHKAQLEDDLLRAAVNNGTTCGKWMLFPASNDLPRYWRVVAEATAKGKLGPVSKVATHEPFNTKDATLICVYTYDFTDQDDLRRVLDELLDLDLCSKDGKPIYYKCDAYTYLNITSENDYKLRASLLSSKDVFRNEAKLMQDGPIARLKKRNETVDTFFST